MIPIENSVAGRVANISTACRNRGSMSWPNTSSGSGISLTPPGVKLAELKTGRSTPGVGQCRKALPR